jgi:predicted MFS family arabinose efflux permease
MNRQLAFFTLIRFVFNTAHRMVYPFLGVIARGLGVDMATISLALTARALVGTLGPLAATVADSRSRKFGMLLGLGVFSFGAGIVAFVPTLAGFTISLVLTTMGKYIFDPGMQAHIGDRVPYERRGRAIAITEMGWSLAYIVGIPLVGLLIARRGWVAPFPLFALLGLLMFAVLYLLLPHEPRRQPSGNGPFSSFRAVFVSMTALAGLAIALLVSAGNELVSLVFGVWLEDSFGLKILALGGAAAVIGLSELSGESLVVGFSDRLGKPRAIALGLVANSLAALLLPVLGRTAPGALIGLFLFYITFEFTVVSMIPMMTEVLPAARATMMAFNISAFSLGRALGASGAPLLYGYSFWAVAAGAVVFNLAGLVALRFMTSQQGIATKPSEV